jgi:HEAT repeat protein
MTLLRSAAVVLALSATVAAQQDLATLVEQLGSTDNGPRSQAYNELAGKRDVAVVPLLGKRITAFPLAGQQFGVYLLQQQPIDATRATYEKLTNADAAFLRAAGAAMLARNGDRSKLPILQKAITKATAEERSYVLNVVWSIDDPGVTSALRGYLDAPGNAGLVVSVLQHLRQCEKARSPETERAVRALLTSEDAGVRAAALAWLAGGPGDTHAKDLATVLRATPDRLWQLQFLLETDRKLDPDLLDAIGTAMAKATAKHQISQITTILRAQNGDFVVTALRALLTNTNEEIRKGALEALATFPGGLDQPTLVRMLADAAPEQQLVAAATLRRMDDVSGLPTVIALAGKKGNHLAETARVLGGFRCEDAVPPLLTLLDDENANVRQTAWQNLQTQWRDLYPYRRFDFAISGYDPQSASRSAGLATLRAWWDARKTKR